MSASELKRLKEPESELSQYKKMYPGLARENYALKEFIEENSRAVGQALGRALSVGPSWTEQDARVCRGEVVAFELVPAGHVKAGSRSGGY